MIPKEILAEAAQLIVAQNTEKSAELARRVIGEGHDPLELMNAGFIPGINQVGELFNRGELFLPQLMGAANAMKAVTDIVNDALTIAAKPREQTGTIVIATVKGDVHDIGKCIVVALLRANGFNVHDLGRDVETEKIIDTAVKLNAHIIGTSTLLTTTMFRQKELEDALNKANLRQRFKTIIGGAPVTQRWASKIGADAYAEDAQEGVRKTRELLLP
jgi:corrinoid protein of di/trimethylamine methyltransferase